MVNVPINVIWEPFYLNDPSSMPKEGVPLMEYIRNKYGEEMMKNFASMKGSLQTAGAKVNIAFNDKRNIVQTKDAHRLMEWTNTKYGNTVGDELMEEMFKEYFEKGSNISDQSVLLECVTRVQALDRVEAATVLSDEQAYKETVLDKIRSSRTMKISGVPYFIVENQHKGRRPYGISGAQPADVLSDVLQESFLEEEE
jgi:predicted DsbA family dithiol-disulfide isomerase